MPKIINSNGESIRDSRFTFSRYNNRYKIIWHQSCNKAVIYNKDKGECQEVYGINAAIKYTDEQFKLKIKTAVEDFLNDGYWENHISDESNDSIVNRVAKFLFDNYEYSQIGWDEIERAISGRLIFHYMKGTNNVP